MTITTRHPAGPDRLTRSTLGVGIPRANASLVSYLNANATLIRSTRDLTAARVHRRSTSPDWRTNPIFTTFTKARSNSA